MPVYAKKTLVTDPIFGNRGISVLSAGHDDLGNTATGSYIPVPDDVVLCNGCNGNLCSEYVVDGEIPFGYLIYLGKRELEHNQYYDIYCKDCLTKYFPKAIEV